MLSQKSRDIIDTTLPTVGAHVNQITEVFYPLMFERYPAVKDYSHGHWPTPWLPMPVIWIAWKFSAMPSDS